MKKLLSLFAVVLALGLTTAMPEAEAAKREAENEKRRAAEKALHAKKLAEQREENEGDIVKVIGIALDLLQGGQGEPGDQPRHILYFVIGLQQ